MEETRIDKWLWAARCFKSRKLAMEACLGGHVEVNEQPAKPAKTVHVGDRIQARTEGGLRILEVIAIADKRGSASVARNLYIDHSPPPPAREKTPAILRPRGLGRPSKKDRRLLGRLRGDDD